MYNRFKIEDMNELLTTTEQDIFAYIKKQCTNNSTTKSNLCSVYKAYAILDIQGELPKSKIDFYTTKQTIEKDEKKKLEQKKQLKKVNL
jgi:hypothetical protein